MWRTEFIQLIVVIPTLLIAPAVANSGWPVEGQSELLIPLRDVQETNRSLFPQGRLKAHVLQSAPAFEGETVVGFWQVEGDIEIQWDRANTYRKTHFDISGAQVPQGIRPIIGETVSTAEWLWAYSDVHQCAQFRRVNVVGLPRFETVRPDEIWLLDPLNNTPLATLVQPDHERWSRSKGMVWRAERTANECVRVTITISSSGREVVLDSSLKHGGNIVACRCRPGTTKQKYRPWEETTWDWAQDSRGRWYPLRLDARTSSDGAPGHAVHFVVDVTDFDGEYRPPPDRFTKESLNIAEGTRIVEWDGLRKKDMYILGQAKPDLPDLQSSLDQLAQQLKSSGFLAAPIKR